MDVPLGTYLPRKVFYHPCKSTPFWGASSALEREKIPIEAAAYVDGYAFLGGRICLPQ
jgi:hypothetical protein